jgi:Lar family restriction alleviation protein
MSGKLLPCPFCGSDASLNEHEGRIASGHYSASVSCDECDDVSTNYCYHNDKEIAGKNAIVSWNSRATNNPTPALVEVVARAIWDEVPSMCDETWDEAKSIDGYDHQECVATYYRFAKAAIAAVLSYQGEATALPPDGETE